mmetsp:Transcript_33287/g.81734  ORF Transcript_33287/g.81734 Transcript_33287/m.81734 type:complete len:103 (-) Transcript_33287:908-1216(-)
MSLELRAIYNILAGREGVPGELCHAILRALSVRGRVVGALQVPQVKRTGRCTFVQPAGEDNPRYMAKDSLPDQMVLAKSLQRRSPYLTFHQVDLLDITSVIQ